ncbi:50S ribosomal protein L3 [Candidatus Uhrbacteria bacterium]|nr:50S ribosomal protein L3 [Candidatus Uhrbacteria bacterium]
MKCILGKKIEMSQRFQENGQVCPVTAIQAGPCYVTQVKTADKDGYEAVQLGFSTKKNVSKALQGHMKRAASFEKSNGFQYLSEVRGAAKGITLGDVVDLSQFKKGEQVEVIGISKGKGFAGVVKRHHFHGHPTSHGHKDQERMPGSIGSGGVQRVFKGLRMAGRMGGDRVTVKNLEVVDIDETNGVVYLKGAVPGPRGGLVQICAEGPLECKKPAIEVVNQQDEQDEEEAKPEMPDAEGGAATEEAVKEVEDQAGMQHTITSSDDQIAQAAQVPGSPQEEVAHEDSEESQPLASEDEPQDSNVDEGTGEVKQS